GYPPPALHAQLGVGAPACRSAATAGSGGRCRRRHRSADRGAVTTPSGAMAQLERGEDTHMSDTNMETSRISVAIARDGAERDACFALRYRVYVEEQGRQAPAADHRRR